MPINTPIGQNMSALNPTDAAYMKQQGGFDINTTTIRDFFKMQGIDVDGPVSQLKRLAQNATVPGKMSNMARPPVGQPPSVQPSAPSTIGRPPMGRSMEEEPNMENLLKEGA